MDSKLELSLDKLPVKRLDAIEEHGAEHFPPDVDYDEKRLALIRRIDFAWAVEKEDKKKQKKSSKESSTPWPWQSMVENLQLAHQELSVIIDLINTVEANDAVTVAGMTRPKQLPNELLSDLAVSAATKLQCFRHLGKYFKQSAKSLEQQVAREARFYGALIRLQQNWKVKRLRIGASAPGNDGFTVDLFDNSFSDPAVISRPFLSTLRVDHDSAGMLAINLPPNSCRSLHFGFLKAHGDCDSSELSKTKTEQFSRESVNPSTSDDDSVKGTHGVLRKVHQTIFDEQVFDLVNHEAFNPSTGVNMTGIRENYLQLNLGQRTSVFISLGPSSQGDETNDRLNTPSQETSASPIDTFDEMKSSDKKQDSITRIQAFPSRASCEIYLRQISHEYMFVKAKDKPTFNSTRVSGQPAKDGSGLLGHFCFSLAHRIFSNKVLMELENVVCRVPYLHLISQPTWHSRISSWTLFMMVPESVRNASSQTRISDIYHMKTIKSQFRIKVVVNEDCINVEGEGAPNAVSLLKGSSEDICPMNRYDCALVDLPKIILQQVASQVIRWLHEEAVMVGIKANRDFLCLTFELEQGETLSLVAHVDPDDPQGCISWWLVMENDFSEEQKLSMDKTNAASEYRKFLGHLSLDTLYSTLMDLVSLCSGGGSVDGKSTV